MLCSSSFEVFNSSFVIYSSARISSISILAQLFHSQRLIFSPVARPLSSTWVALFLLSEFRNGKKIKFFLYSILCSHQFRLRCPTESKCKPVSVYVCTGAPVCFFLKYRKCIKERRVQLEPALLLLPPPLPPSPQAPAFNFQKHCNCLVWFQELGCHSP